MTSYRGLLSDYDAGVTQRIQAINLFLGDVYGKGLILKDGVVPRDLVEGNANYRKEMRQVKVRHGTYVHIGGIDIVRDQAGEFCVLEDNCRTPSGVSYVIENRHLMQRTFPDLLDGVGVRSVSNYGNRLRRALGEVAPARIKAPEVVLLSPGVFNSAYFEHVFLAREMGVPLVEGRDLFVENDRVCMTTLTVIHRTTYAYNQPVTLGPHFMMIRAPGQPRPAPGGHRPDNQPQGQGTLAP